MTVEIDLRCDSIDYSYDHSFFSFLSFTVMSTSEKWFRMLQQESICFFMEISCFYSYDRMRVQLKCDVNIFHTAVKKETKEKGEETILLAAAVII